MPLSVVTKSRGNNSPSHDLLSPASQSSLRLRPTLRCPNSLVVIIERRHDIALPTKLAPVTVDVDRQARALIFAAIVSTSRCGNDQLLACTRHRRHDRVFEFGMHGRKLIARQRPGRGRPDQAATYRSRCPSSSSSGNFTYTLGSATCAIALARLRPPTAPCRPGPTTRRSCGPGRAARGRTGSSATTRRFRRSSGGR